MPEALPMRRGGQTKVSLPRLQRFIQLVASGLTLGQAAKGIGIGDQTRMDWMRRGRTELVRLSDAGWDIAELIDPTERDWPTEQTWTQIPPGFEPYEWPFSVFVVGVEKALAEFEARNVAVVQRAANGAPARYDQAGNLLTASTPSTWQAAAWLLERRFPELYGRAESRLRQQVDVTVSPGLSADSVLSVEDMDARLRELDDIEAKRAQQ